MLSGPCTLPALHHKLESAFEKYALTLSYIEQDRITQETHLNKTGVPRSIPYTRPCKLPHQP